jgi:hypothetical protein
MSTSYPKLTETAERFYGQALAACVELFNRLAGRALQQSGHGAIEARLRQKGNEVLRLGFQGYLEQRGEEEEVLESLVGSDGEKRTGRRRACKRKIESVFGEVRLSRMGYEGPGLKRIYPLDAALNLPADCYTHGLRAEVADLVIGGSFEAGVNWLRRRSGGRVAKRQMQELAVTLSQDFETYYAQRSVAANDESYGEEGRASKSAEVSDLLVISADGKGVVRHESDRREQTRRAAALRAQEKSKGRRKGRRRRQAPSAKEKGDRKRMATVATVYDIASHERSAETLLNREEALESKRPKPQQKRVWAGIREALGEVLGQAFEEALRRDPEHKRTWVVLIDGQEELIRRIESSAAAHKQEIFLLQDFVHVEEYLWRAAHALFPDKAEQKAERERWIEKRLKRMLEGRAQDVATGLRRAASRKELSDKEAEPVHKAADYIEKNQQRMRYDIALERGYPIATGVIEGACRHLVKDRMELTGARWRLNDAEAILRLRALHVSGDLDDYLGFHFQQDLRRNYPPPPIPADQAAA